MLGCAWGSHRYSIRQPLTCFSHFHRHSKGSSRGLHCLCSYAFIFPSKTVHSLFSEYDSVECHPIYYGDFYMENLYVGNCILAIRNATYNATYNYVLSMMMEASKAPTWCCHTSSIHFHYIQASVLIRRLSLIINHYRMGHTNRMSTQTRVSAKVVNSIVPEAADKLPDYAPSGEEKVCTCLYSFSSRRARELVLVPIDVKKAPYQTDKR